MPETVIVEHSRSVAHRELPPLPDPLEPGTGSILLFYQYQEPVWTKKEHKAVLKQVIALGEQYDIQGRGRVAPEGLNCTLSSRDSARMREFCRALRAWNALFEETDFKITDGVPHAQLFQSLSIRKTDELVAYGMAGARAPSLQHFAGQHLEADEYHEALQDPNAVVIDVRNYYESCIGGFRPEGGAQVLDPKMRNSIEWSKWLADPATQKQLHGKKVLTYCTGGIRCERATALINQMAAVNPDKFQPEGVYELRGGIERYIKTFPDGGHWKGKNYLFDKRKEQIPANRTMEEVEAEINTVCCLCLQKCTTYKGRHKCSQGLCGVAVIVCDHCNDSATAYPDLLQCDLCREGYRAPELAPDLVTLKRKAEAVVDPKAGKRAQFEEKPNSSTRLFISRLPLAISKEKLADWLDGDIRLVQWLVDRTSGAFYGSCFVEMANAELVAKIVKRPALPFTGSKKKPKVAFAKETSDAWPPVDYKESEYPPIGN